MDLKKSKEGDRRSASSSSRLTSFDVVRANSLDNPQGTSSRDTSYIYGEKLEKDYQKRIRSLRKEGLDKLFLDRIQPTLQKAGLNINDSKSWDSNQEGKKFMDIVEEASNHVYGEKLAQDQERLIKFLREKGLDEQFKAKMVPMLESTGLARPTNITSWNSDQRKLYEDILNEASEHVYRLLKDYQNVIVSLQKEDLYTQFRLKTQPKLQDAGLNINDSTSWDSDQRKQFKNIVEEASNHMCGEKLEKDYQKFIGSLQEKGLNKSFLDRIQPKLQDAGLNINDSTSWDSDQREQFKDIVEEVSKHVCGEKLEKDYQKIIEALQEEGLNKLFLERVKPTLKDAGLNINDSTSWDSDQRKQFEDIVNKTSSYVCGEKLRQDQHNLIRFLEGKGLIEEFKTKMVLMQDNFTSWNSDQRELYEDMLDKSSRNAYRLLKDYQNDIRSLQKEGLDKPFLERVKPTLKDAGLNINDCTSWNSNRRKQFKDIVEEASKPVCGGKLEKDHQKLTESLQKEGLDKPFLERVKPTLKDAGLNNYAFTSWDSDQRKQFKDIVEKASKHVRREKLEKDHQKLTESLQKEGLYKQYNAKIVPELLKAGIIINDFTGWSDDQKNQFLKIAVEAVKHVREENFAKDYQELIKSLENLRLSDGEEKKK
ncbi:MAG TPA: hypothetical protein VGL94_20350 [Ktedonobacteraceae bacterium]